MNTREIIIQALIKDGYSEYEAIAILSKYLDEEAEEYLECMRILEDNHTRFLMS